MLSKIIEERKQPHERELPASFVWYSAVNINELAKDLELLMSANRTSSGGLITRAMMESFFNLSAMKERQSFAAEKVVYELKDWMRRSRQLPFPLNHLETETFNSVENACVRICDKYGVTLPVKKLGVYRCAAIGKAEKFFRNQYFHLSLQTHGTLFGIVGRSFPNVLRLGENAAIFCVLYAASHLLSTFPNQYPGRDDEYQAQVGSMLDELGEEVRINSRLS